MNDCFLCGSKGGLYANVDSYDYLRCQDCGVIYVDTIEPTDKLYSSYDGGFWKSLRRKLFMPFRRFERVRHFNRSMERANRILDRVQSLVPQTTSRSVFLDIGCNKGFLLAAALSHSWDVFGVELVSELTLPFKRRYPAYAGNIISRRFIESQEGLKDGMFDAITAIDVIEHFEEPLRDMGHIFRVLKPEESLSFKHPTPTIL